MDRTADTTPIAGMLDQIFLQCGYLGYVRERKLIAEWAEIVGPVFGKVTQCTEIKDGVAYVKVKSSTWRTEIRFYKQELLQKIRVAARCEMVKDVVFV